MGEQSGRPNAVAEAPLGVSEEIPPLVVQRDRLIFSVGGRSMHIPLAELLEAGDAAAAPLLLYAAVLKLRDIDHSLRRLADAAEQSQRIVETQIRMPPVDQILGDLMRHLREAGMAPPDAAAPTGVAGDGRGAV